jgi:hypothetical protein
MKKKKLVLYLVDTTTGDKWEITGGSYLVKATSKKEVEKMKLTILGNEKIVSITPISKLQFNKGIHVITGSVVE